MTLFVPAPPRVSPGPSESGPVPPLIVPIHSEAWFDSPSDYFATRSWGQGRVTATLLLPAPRCPSSLQARTQRRWKQRATQPPR